MWRQTKRPRLRTEVRPQVLTTLCGPCGSGRVLDVHLYNADRRQHGRYGHESNFHHGFMSPDEALENTDHHSELWFGEATAYVYVFVYLVQCVCALHNVRCILCDLLCFPQIHLVAILICGGVDWSNPIVEHLLMKHVAFNGQSDELNHTCFSLFSLFRNYAFSIQFNFFFWSI